MDFQLLGCKHFAVSILHSFLLLGFPLAGWVMQEHAPIVLFLCSAALRVFSVFPVGTKHVFFSREKPSPGIPGGRDVLAGSATAGLATVPPSLPFRPTFCIFALWFELWEDLALLICKYYMDFWSCRRVNRPSECVNYQKQLWIKIAEIFSMGFTKPSVKALYHILLCLSPPGLGSPFRGYA